MTQAKTKKITFCKKKTDKKEMRGDNESALKRSTRQWQRHQNEKEISEVRKLFKQQLNNLFFILFILSFIEIRCYGNRALNTLC